MNLMTDIIKSFWHRLEVLMAFGAGATVGFGAGLSCQALDKLIQSDENEAEDKEGIEYKKAKELKEELETNLSVPETV